LQEDIAADKIGFKEYPDWITGRKSAVGKTGRFICSL